MEKGYNKITDSFGLGNNFKFHLHIFIIPIAL